MSTAGPLESRVTPRLGNASNSFLCLVPVDMRKQPSGVIVRPVLSLILTLLLGAPAGSPLAAEQAAAASAKLNVVVIQGEGAVNNLRRRVPADPIIQVEDANHRPVPAAAVLFTVPDAGPSAAFGGNSRSLLVRTDSAGRAVARGLRANDVPGKFQIRVQVSLRGLSATGSITQVNADLTASAKKGGRTKVVVILTAVGAAAAAGVVINNRNKNTAATSIGISAGTPAVGGPQ